LRLIAPEGFMSLATSEDALVEAQYNLRRSNPASNGADIALVRERIVGSIDELVTSYQVPAEPITSDVFDNHIIAAARAWGADYLVTDDKGFDAMSSDVALLDSFDFEVYKPDDFFMLVVESAPQFVRAVAIQQHNYWTSRNHSKSVVSALRDAACPKFAKTVENLFKELAGL